MLFHVSLRDRLNCQTYCEFLEITSFSFLLLLELRCVMVNLGLYVAYRLLISVNLIAVDQMTIKFHFRAKRFIRLWGANTAPCDINILPYVGSIPRVRDATNFLFGGEGGRKSGISCMHKSGPNDNHRQWITTLSK
jgi:hypothetical protein